MASFDFLKDCTRNSDNTVNIDATVELFRTQLETALEFQDKLDSSIKPAFDYAFAMTEKVEGKEVYRRWAAPALVNYVTFRLARDKSLAPDEQETLREQVNSWLRINSCDKRDGGKPIRVAKGRGGCQLWSNLPQTDS